MHRIVDFGASQVFAATTYTCLLFLNRNATDEFQWGISRATSDALSTTVFTPRQSKSLSEQPWTFETPATSSLLDKLRAKGVRLLDLPVEFSRGSSTGADEAFVFEKGALDVEAEILREPLYASDFSRYEFSSFRKWRVIFPYVRDGGKYRSLREDEVRKSFPKAYAHLKSHVGVLKARKQFKEWFLFSAPRNLDIHDRAQIAVPLLADRGLCALIPKGKRGKLCPMASGGFTLHLGENLRLRPEFILALLNSKLLFWCLRRLSNVFRGGWITCTKQYVGELPVRRMNLSKPSDKQQHDTIAERVSSMVELHEKLLLVRTPHEKEILHRQVNAHDAQLDHLVYDLFALTKSERDLVENSLSV